MTARNRAVAPFVSIDPTMVDDNSCKFDIPDAKASVGEHGFVDVTATWQKVTLNGNFEIPLVFSGILSRQIATKAAIRLRNVVADAHGVWSFEIRAEQKLCHRAHTSSIAERVSYLVVEAGISMEGWQ